MSDQFSTPGAGESAALTRGCDCYVHLYGAIGDGHRTPRYDSDMTDCEWAVIRVAMPMPAWLEGKGGRPEAHCHRGMVDQCHEVRARRSSTRSFRLVSSLV